MSAGISVKHLSTGLVHIIATTERGTVRLTVTKEYARKVAAQLLGDEPGKERSPLHRALADLLKGKDFDPFK